MMLRSYLIILILLFTISIQMMAQTPVAHFSFDDCMPTEENGTFINNLTNGNPQCVCGPNGMALEFDGANDFIRLDDELKNIFINDFALTMQVWFEDAPQKYNVFAVKKPDCIDIDSTMHIAYDPISNLIEFNFARNIGDRITVFEPLDQSKCWHQIAISKSGTEYSFYVDQKFISTENFGTNYVMSDSATIYLANTECASSTEQLMPGRIDELKLFNMPLSANEVNDQNIPIDQLLTQDMTIFSGESVDVISSSTCAPNFSWNTTNGFDVATTLSPRITPPQSETYIVTYDYGNCSTNDSIRINVLDVADRNCDQLLLPKAFTPNDDGLNDTYGISNDFLIDDLIYFEIYDRWGTKVFETNDLNVKWDGTLRGVPINANAFVYKIKYICQGEELASVGNFSILR